jgi:hypothetical protein
MEPRTVNRRVPSNETTPSWPVPRNVFLAVLMITFVSIFFGLYVGKEYVDIKKRFSAELDHEANQEQLVEFWKGKAEQNREELETALGELETTRRVLGDRNKPFVPKFGLTPEQNKLCLAIVTFTEANGEPTKARETMAWAIVNRAIDARATMKKYTHYQSNICAVAVSKSQYSGMGPYVTDINDVVWGKITEFTPALAKKNEEEMKAWKDILRISSEIVDGKLTRKTTATHFISFRGMKGAKRPSWVDYFMPVHTTTESGLHTLYRDYGYDRKTGELVFFSKQIPYNPNLHRY